MLAGQLSELVACCRSISYCAACASSVRSPPTFCSSVLILGYKVPQDDCHVLTARHLVCHLQHTTTTRGMCTLLAHAAQLPRWPMRFLRNSYSMCRGVLCVRLRRAWQGVRRRRLVSSHPTSWQLGQQTSWEAMTPSLQQKRGKVMPGHQ